MGLRKYYIDGSSVPSEEISSVSNFIECNAWNSQIVLDKQCSYIALWEENINPADFPLLKHCKIEELL